jgi:hypothetical protein
MMPRPDLLSNNLLRRLQGALPGASEETRAALDARIDEIVKAKNEAWDYVVAAFAEKAERRRAIIGTRVSRLNEEHRALVTMVKEDYGRAIGRVSEYRAALIAERDTILKEMVETWNDFCKQDQNDTAELREELSRALKNFRKTIMREGKAEIAEALDEAREQTRQRQVERQP